MGYSNLLPIQNPLPKECRVFDGVPVQQANKIYNVDHADTVNNICNIYALPEAKFSPYAMNTDYYNLFVVAGREKPILSPFYLPISVTLQKGTSQEVKDELLPLDTNARHRIISFPSIFTTTNSQQGKTDTGHRAIYGKVESIEDYGEGFIISWGFIRFCNDRNSAPSIPQMDIISHAESFGLGVASCSNELDEVHWAIKKLNVIKALSKIGIEAMVY